MTNLKKTFNSPDFIDAKKYFDLAEESGPEAAFRKLFEDLGLPAETLKVGPTSDFHNKIWGYSQIMASCGGALIPSNGAGLTTSSSGFGKTEDAAMMDQLIRLLDTQEATHLFVERRDSPNTDYVRGKNFQEIKIKKAERLPTVRPAAALSQNKGLGQGI